MDALYQNNMKWIRADMAINLVDNLVKKGGETEESIKKSKEFDKTREGWIAAVFLLSKCTQEIVWYIRENDIQNSESDIFALPIDYGSDAPTSTGQISIQVTRITEYSPDGIIDALKKKLTHDLNDISLVCYILRDQKILWEKLMKEIIKFKPKVGSITLIGNIGNRNYTVGQVYPSINVKEISLDQTMTLAGGKIIIAEKVFKKEQAGINHMGDGMLTRDFKIV